MKLDNKDQLKEKKQISLSVEQYGWLIRGMTQPAGKLPLFDSEGSRIDPKIILSCLQAGWAEPWFSNPIKADWLVCKLTSLGRRRVTLYQQGDTLPLHKESV